MANPNASTISTEQARVVSIKHDRSADKNVQIKQGVITAVHETKPLVKANFINGQSVAGGKFIPVQNSSLDIIHRFGALRPGMKVMVAFSGDVARDAVAEVIGAEDEKVGSEVQEDNDIATPLYEIFTPGIGF